MTLYKHIAQQKRSALTILFTSIIVGLAYPLAADSLEDWVGRLNGFLVGILGGVAIILFELHVFFLPKKIYSFTFILVSKVFCYTVTFILIILFVVLITRSLEKHVSILTYLRGDDFWFFIIGEGPVIASYTFTAIIIVITTRQISRKMGPGVLFNYIIGKYHRPKKEHRIFLAIDLQNSTSIAEQLGDLKYHEFLKQYFYDLTYSITACKGRIYRYVGDQVMISWLLSDGIKNGNAIQCFFKAQELIEQQRNFYKHNFTIIPKFRGALDMGEVLAAEIGLDKQQIVFYGDIMQRIVAIEKVGKQQNQNLLISEYLAIPFKESGGVQFTYCATLKEDMAVSIKLFTAKPVQVSY